MTGRRSHAGWVIVYKNDPAYKGMDRFVAKDRDGSWHANCHDAYDAHHFITPEEAFGVLTGREEVGPGWLRGAVHRVDNQVQTVLAGESFADINDLLKKLQEARPVHACRSRGPIPDVKQLLASAFKGITGR